MNEVTMTPSLTERLRVLKEKDENGLLSCPFSNKLMELGVVKGGNFANCNSINCPCGQIVFRTKKELMRWFGSPFIRESALIAGWEEALREVAKRDKMYEIVRDHAIAQDCDRDGFYGLRQAGNHVDAPANQAQNEQQYNDMYQYKQKTGHFNFLLGSVIDYSCARSSLRI